MDSRAAWYLEYQESSIAPKGRLIVRGSKVTIEGKQALIAAEVARGDDVLRLRDDEGIPLWAGWRRGR